jgi:hypothetical protein
MDFVLIDQFFLVFGCKYHGATPLLFFNSEWVNPASLCGHSFRCAGNYWPRHAAVILLPS